MSKDNATKQIDKFKEATRDLETDQSEQHSDAMLKQIAKARRAPYDEAVARAGKARSCGQRSS